MELLGVRWGCVVLVRAAPASRLASDKAVCMDYSFYRPDIGHRPSSRDTHIVTGTLSQSYSLYQSVIRHVLNTRTFHPNQVKKSPSKQLYLYQCFLCENYSMHPFVQ